MIVLPPSHLYSCEVLRIFLCLEVVVTHLGHEIVYSNHDFLSFRSWSCRLRDDEYFLLRGLWKYSSHFEFKLCWWLSWFRVWTIAMSPQGWNSVSESKWNSPMKLALESRGMLGSAASLGSTQSLVYQLVKVELSLAEPWGREWLSNTIR